PRGESEVESLLGIPLLARLGSPFPNRSERRLSDLGGLMNGRAAKRTASVNRDDVAAIRSSLNEPASVIAEGIRRLRTKLELANIDANAKSILVTSATAHEGKSSTMAHLALAFARAQNRVALVDLDLRHPTIGRYFGLEGRRGVTDVALKRVTLD